MAEYDGSSISQATHKVGILLHPRPNQHWEQLASCFQLSGTLILREPHVVSI